jgi:hypothetical protein
MVYLSSNKHFIHKRNDAIQIFNKNKLDHGAKVKELSNFTILLTQNNSANQLLSVYLTYINVRALLPVKYLLCIVYICRITFGNRVYPFCGVTVVIFGLIFQRRQKGVKWRWWSMLLFIAYSFHSTTDVSARTHSQCMGNEAICRS